MSFLIFFTAMCICIVTWVAFACIWIVKQLKWLRERLHRVFKTGSVQN